MSAAYLAGMAAYGDGEPRTCPYPYPPPGVMVGSPAAKEWVRRGTDWYRGWDTANAADDSWNVDADAE